MFCTKCGTENEDGAKFCTGCGQMLQEEKQTTDMTPNVKPERVKKNMTKTVNLKGIVGVGVIIVLLIVVLGIVTNSRRTINLNKYLTIEASGYDGYGKVTARINWSEINDKYGSKVKFTSRAKKEVGDFLDMVTPMDIIQESVHVVVKNDEDISNGDVITYTWSVDSNLSQYVKCKLKYKEDTYEVSGLEEIEEFDPFEDLEVTFSGMAPNGSVNLNYVGDELSAYDFHSDSVNGLSNGDTITVSIEDGRAEYCIKEYGKMPEKMEAKYEVQGLDSYVMSFSEIDGATLEEMQKQASDVFHAEVARDWNEEEEKSGSLT